MSALRFGVLGTGYWAAETHTAGLAAHPEAELVGVWGRDPAKAAALAERYAVRPYGDVDALLADVDAVAVSLPPAVQAELAVRGADAGRHLLLDKPLARDVAAAEQVVAAVERAGVASVVFFTRRFQPDIEEFLARLAAVGGWDGARVTMVDSIFQAGNPYAGSVWRREEYGALWDVGPHALSVLLPVLGPVSRVAAADGPHASTHALLTHAGGAVSTLMLGLDAPAAATAQETVFHGTAGFAATPRVTDYLAAYGNAISALVAAARDGADAHPCDARFGRDVVAILAAAETAAREQRVVTL